MSEDFDDVLRRFRREMLGPMVAHMDDAEVERYVEQVAEAYGVEEIGTATSFPGWLQKRFDEERVRLLRVLGRRG